MKILKILDWIMDAAISLAITALSLVAIGWSYYMFDNHVTCVNIFKQFCVIHG